MKIYVVSVVKQNTDLFVKLSNIFLQFTSTAVLAVSEPLRDVMARIASQIKRAYGIANYCLLRLVHTISNKGNSDLITTARKSPNIVTSTTNEGKKC